MSPKRTRTRQLALEAIELSAEILPRTGLKPPLVRHYAEILDALPPLGVLVTDDGRHLLWDGRHRYEAAVSLRRTEATCQVRHGSLAQARWLAAGANAHHGLPLNQAERRRAIAFVLADKPELSDRAIAKQVGCTPMTVGRCRRKNHNNVTVAAPRLARKAGKTYRMSTQNIGRRARPLVDAAGAELPAWLRTAAEESKRVEACIVVCQQLKQDVAAIESRGALDATLVADLTDLTGMITDRLRATLLHAACPDCRAFDKPRRGCPACFGRGWLTEIEYNKQVRQF